MNGRPADVCRGLLAALEASEGRRQRRKRDTTPDAVGLGIKRAILDRAVAEDPEPEDFEAWLLEQCTGLCEPYGVGAVQAMALEILHDWRLARKVESFGGWLAQGAPSDDRA